MIWVYLYKYVLSWICPLYSVIIVSMLDLEQPTDLSRVYSKLSIFRLVICMYKFRHHHICLIATTTIYI